MKRAVLIILSASLVIDICWVLFVVHDLRTNQVQTKATVVAIQFCQYQKGSHCPTFSYSDSSGKLHRVMSTEGFNSINKPLFGIHVGDTRPAWYEKSDPGASYILYGAGMLSVWVLPIAVGAFASVTAVFVGYYRRAKARPRPSKWHNG